MTQLIVEKKVIPSANFNGESSLPPVSFNNESRFIPRTDEEDGLYVNYGFVGSAYPYKTQDMYDRALDPTPYDSVVLENAYLKATFMPALGGRLWSLIDKEKGKDLLFANDVVRPGNLATRNAWLSGGVEWNCGFFGHHPHTCSLLNTAQTSLADGTPVLRFYYFERVRGVVVQMDFFLPDESKLLFCRMRVTNPNYEITPIYWWSNIAVEEKDGSRVIVPADMSYTAIAEGNDAKGRPVHGVQKIQIPIYKNRDITYPRNNTYAIDYFWATKSDVRKYICQLDKDGYGLVQASTERLKGRKLFVWGNSQGGSRWQNYLTADDKSGSYTEIQCGLANSQYECLPMPPRTVWEWVECYGAMQADKDIVHGDWAGAQQEVQMQLDKLITEETLDRILADTKAMAKAPAEKLLIPMNEGWGALELYRRQKGSDDLMSSHLDFGCMGDAQDAWLKLLDEGTVGEHATDDVPASYMRQGEWLELLEIALEGKDADNWYAHYLYGTAMTCLQKYQKAEMHLKKSIALNSSAWANYALAINYRMQNNQELYQKYMRKAFDLRPNDISLVKEVLLCLHMAEKSEEVIKIFESASEEMQQVGRCRMYYAYALARVGRIDEAEYILLGNGYLTPPDIREGEVSMTGLWYYIQEQKFPGQPVGDPPKPLDFRMQAARDD